MRATPKLVPCLLIFLMSVLAFPQQTKAKETSEPEMVWVTFAGGEVKFSPGHNGKPVLGSNWIQATTGQAMEDGYTLATEKGRAEVEFENGTVVYLAEGSVLQFKKLRIAGETTEAQLNLVTGTATIAHVSRGHDVLRLETLSTKMKVPDTRTLRMESSLNGTVIQAVEGEVPLSAGLLGAKVNLKAGESAAYIDGELILLKELNQTPQGDEWDQWVKTRRAERQTLIEKGLRETGMKEPIPGLAAMVKGGRFFDCAPYGKCWEPVETAEQGGAGYVQASTGAGRRDFVINKTLVRRCPMEAWMYSVGRPSAPGLLAANEPEQTFTLSGGLGFGYGTCFAGSWVDACGYPDQMGGWGSGRCGTRWRWVVGGRERHHHCHYVKVPHGVGVIPPHPLDQKGKLPVNAKSGILMLTQAKGGVTAGLERAPKRMQLLTNPPARIEKGFEEKAPRVAQPVIQARVMGDVTRGVEEKNAMRIQYDYRTKNFVTKGTTSENARAGVVAHLGGHDTRVNHVPTNENGRSSAGHNGAGGSSRGSSGGAGGGSQAGSHASNSGSSGNSHGSSSGGGGNGGGHSGGSSGSSSATAPSAGGGGKTH
jgi:hypothetical protein